ncbi:MAG: hypothetical protein WCK26_01490 [Candidatus Saccharibacteria bacterium]
MDSNSNIPIENVVLSSEPVDTRVNIQVNKKDNSKIIKISFISLILLIIATGVGAYLSRDNQANLQKTNDANKIKELEEKVTELEKSSASSSTGSTLGNLQINQRDTQRKNDLARITTQLTNYASNNRGKIPVDLTSITDTENGKSFVQNYLGGVSANISGPEYIDPKLVKGYDFVSSSPDIKINLKIEIGQIAYQPAAICGSGSSLNLGNARQFTLRVILEKNATLYCVDNS